MALTRIGILSDTHLSAPSDTFRARAANCFAGVSMILHAGDLTELSVLDVFQGVEVHAVHGNMCSAETLHALPAGLTIRVGNFTIGLVHRMGNSYDFEDRLIEIFPEADCIVYGHTHRPVCHCLGQVLYLNPGSFSGTGRHGAPATYGIIEVGDRELRGSIHQVGQG
ncbi:MAG: YfcE family phosphodiesterase [Desulfobulbaceae bacterium]|nr:YfcE family phosphodiesterase [Desulfobulbaceae bacterium]